MRDVNRGQAFGAPGGPAPDPLPASPGPMHVLCGPMLCRLHVWSEFEWTALPDSERPIRSEHVDGLGWVGAIPVQCLN
jgi:hypothetical protein